MYAWYYLRSWYASVVVGTHDWQSAAVWIDNPAVASPKVKGLSTSKKTETDPQAPEITKETFKSEDSYGKLTSGLEKYFNGTSPMLTSTLIMGPVFLRPGTIPGKFQDLIMWDQLTAPARTALNGPDIGDVPFSDANFQKKLKEAWPF